MGFSLLLLLSVSLLQLPLPLILLPKLTLLSTSFLFLFFSFCLLVIYLIVLPSSVSPFCSTHLSTFFIDRVSSSSPYTTQQHNTPILVSHFHEPYPLSSSKKTQGMLLYSQMDQMEGRRLGKYFYNILIRLTKGTSLSMLGLSFANLGIMGSSLIVLGTEGCIRGRLRHFVQDCFLNLTNVCGIFLYLMFHNSNPSNSSNLSITSIYQILLSILSPQPRVRDQQPPRVRLLLRTRLLPPMILSYSSSLLLLLVFLATRDFSDPQLLLSFLQSLTLAHLESLEVFSLDSEELWVRIIFSLCQVESRMEEVRKVLCQQGFVLVVLLLIVLLLTLLVLLYIKYTFLLLRQQEYNSITISSNHPSNPPPLTAAPLIICSISLISCSGYITKNLSFLDNSALSLIELRLYYQEWRQMVYKQQSCLSWRKSQVSLVGVSGWGCQVQGQWMRGRQLFLAIFYCYFYFMGDFFYSYFLVWCSGSLPWKYLRQQQNHITSNPYFRSFPPSYRLLLLLLFYLFNPLLLPSLINNQVILTIFVINLFFQLFNYYYPCIHLFIHFFQFFIVIMCRLWQLPYQMESKFLY